MRVSNEIVNSGPTQAGPAAGEPVWEVTPSLTVIDGPGVGDCFQLDEERRAAILGRDMDADLVIRHPTVSRRHARLFVEYAEGSDRVRLVDLQSRNGTFVNGQQVADAYLSPGDKLQIGDVLLRFDLMDPRDLDFLKKIVSKARSADHDPLTGLATRSCLDSLAAELEDRTERTGRGASILMIDLDHFKGVNDAFGHLVGDEALKAAARVVLRSIRNRDTAVRFGGEEMVVILPDTDPGQALHVAERIRTGLPDEAVPGLPPERRLTASIGLAAMVPGQSLEDAVDRADAALYEAKDLGRDRVCLKD